MKKYNIVLNLFVFVFILFASIFVLFPQNVLAGWKAQPLSGEHSWTAMASSSDGTKLVAVVHDQGVGYEGYIYTSSDSGVTWIRRDSAGRGNWWTVASSSNGTKLAAAEYYGGFIWTSSDSGETWVRRDGPGERYWSSIASSSDGTKLVAVDYSGHYCDSCGYIWTSSDSGNTWTRRDSAGQDEWITVASSSDGTKLFAGPFSQVPMHISNDSGVTWQHNTGIYRSESWHSVTSSADGTKLAVSTWTGSPDYLFTSSDSGNTWTPNMALGKHKWEGYDIVTSSADGIKIAAAEFGGYIYVSNDSGNTWTPQTDGIGKGGWTSLSYSADGTKLAAALMHGLIYTYSDDVPPVVAPTLTTQGATSITTTGVTLNGTITSVGDFTAKGFQYGLTTSYGSTTGDTGSFSTGSYAKTISGLTCGTQYNYRSYATNSTGTGYGDNMTFTTTSCTTNTYTITASSGSGGTVTPTGVTTNTLGSSKTFSIYPSAGYHVESILVDGTLGNLTSLGIVGSGGTYTFTNINTNHTISGSFAVNTSAPTLTTQGATSITTTGVTLNGTITSVGDFTAKGFQYGLTTSYGSTTGDTGSFSTGSYAKTISGLTCGTQYNYRSYATNSTGTGYGDNMTFTTTSCTTNTYTITASSGSGGTVTPTGVTTNTLGSSKTFSIYPSAGYHVESILVDGTLGNLTSLGIVGSGGTYTFTNINTNHTISGSFAVNTSAPRTYNFGNTTLKNGSRGEAVKELQRFLNEVLDLGLVVDGKLGPKTINVIKRWQMDHDLTPDGLIGPKTKAKMNASV